MYSGTINDIHFNAGAWPPAEDRPTLVFVHGSGGDSQLWTSQVRELSGVANTVALDLPSHGGSPGTGCRDVASYARKVMEFIRSAGLPKPVPCGLSIGGGIVLQLLLDFSEELFAGILVSTGARLRVAPEIFDAIASDYPAFVDRIPDLAVSPKTPRDRIRPVLEAMARTPPEVTAGDFHACDKFDVMDRLREIRRPVLVITAQEDRLTPPKYGACLESNITGAQRAHIPAAGHMVPIEKPKAVGHAIGAFLVQLGGQ